MGISAQESREIVRRYAQMFDTGDLDEADELFAPDFRLYSPTPRRSGVGS